MIQARAEKDPKIITQYPPEVQEAIKANVPKYNDSNLYVSTEISKLLIGTNEKYTNSSFESFSYGLQLKITEEKVIPVIQQEQSKEQEQPAVKQPQSRVESPKEQNVPKDLSSFIPKDLSLSSFSFQESDPLNLGSIPKQSLVANLQKSNGLMLG